MVVRRTHGCLTAVLFALCCAVPWSLSHGATITWNVAGDGAWDTTTANWTGDNTVFTDDGTVDVVFDNTAGGTITIDADMTPQSVTVSAASGTYTFTGGPIDGSTGLVKTGGGTLAFTAAATNTYTGTTVISDGVLALSAASNVATASTIQLDGGTLRTLRETGDSSTTISLYNNIVLTDDSIIDTQFTNNTYLRGVISGDYGFTKSGSNYLNLAAVNTYTGETILEQSTTYINANGALGTTDGATTVRNGAWISLEISNYSVAETLYLDNATMRTSSTSSTSPRYWGGNIVLVSESSIQAKYNSTTSSGGLIVIDGVISGNARLLVGRSEAGNVRFTNANTYTGDTRIVRGTLQLYHTQAMQSSTLDLLSSDTGMLLFGTPTAYTLGGLKGTRDLDMGGNTLSIGANGQSTEYSGVLNNGALTKVGAGTLTLSGANTHTGDTRVAEGTLTLAHASAIAGSTLDLAAGDTGTVAFGTPAAYTFGGLKGTRDLDMGGNTLTIGVNGQSTEYSGDLSNGSLVKTGAGTLTLKGTNTHSAMTVSEGSLEFLTNANLGAAGAGITLDGGTLQYDGTTDNYSVNRSITLTADSYLRSTGSSVRWAGVVSDGADVFGITVTGGPVYLANSANDYDGVTRVASGTLYAAANGVLGTTTGATIVESGTILTVVANYTTLETLYLNGGALRTSYGGGGTATWCGDVILGADSNIRAKYNNGQGTLVVAGAISGDHGVTFGGEAGIVKLTGMNTYTGASSLTSGTLVVDGSIAASSGLATASGTLLQGSGAVPAISGAGLVSPGNSPGILTATSVDPAGGLDFAFEFTAAAPDYTSATGSLNDVLRLTDASDPLTAALSSDNEIGIYLNVTDLDAGDVFLGGFYTDLGEDFADLLAGATVNAYVALDGNGTNEFEGANYYALAELAFPLNAVLGTVSATADFGSGAIQGYVMQVTVLPEPSAFLLAVLAIVGLLVRRRRGAFSAR